MKREATIDAYTTELETLIADTLLPAYIEYCRLMGRPNPTKNINTRLTEAMKTKRKIPAILQRVVEK